MGFAAYRPCRWAARPRRWARTRMTIATRVAMDSWACAWARGRFRGKLISVVAGRDLARVNEVGRPPTTPGCPSGSDGAFGRVVPSLSSGHLGEGGRRSRAFDDVTPAS